MAPFVKRLEKPGMLVSRYDSHQLHSGYVVLEPGKDVGEHTTEGREELIVMVEGKAEVTSNGHAETVKLPAWCSSTRTQFMMSGTRRRSF